MTDRPDAADADTEEAQPGLVETELSIGRRGFGRGVLAGAAGLTGLAGLAGETTASTEWREAYFEAVEAGLPRLYDALTTREAVETMLATEAEHTAFFDVLGEYMDLEAAQVTSAVLGIDPCDTPRTRRPHRGTGRSRWGSYWRTSWRRYGNSG